MTVAKSLDKSVIPLELAHFVSNSTGFCALMFKIKWYPFCISGYVSKTAFYCCLVLRVLTTTLATAH